jgi:coenzyme F420 hydrogenase subunit beta
MALPANTEKWFKELKTEIIDQKACTLCGLCCAVCPEKSIIIEDDKIKLSGVCSNCGLCYLVCHRTSYPKSEIDRMVFGRERTELEKRTGIYLKCILARSNVREIRDEAQYGGTTTSILLSSLREGWIDGAIVVIEGEKWVPKPALATSEVEILQSRKSKYGETPNLSILRNAAERGLKKIAIVGTPCHIRAIRKLGYITRSYSNMKPELLNLLKKINKNIELVVGLPCFGNFITRGIRELLSDIHVNPEDVKKLAFAGPNILIYLRNGSCIQISQQSLFPYVSPSCLICSEYLAQASDISIGISGAPSMDWNIVFIRTPKGEEHLKKAVQNNLVEIKEAESRGREVRLSLSSPKMLKMMSYGIETKIGEIYDGTIKKPAEISGLKQAPIDKILSDTRMLGIESVLWAITLKEELIYKKALEARAGRKLYIPKEDTEK